MLARVAADKKHQKIKSHNKIQDHAYPQTYSQEPNADIMHQFQENSGGDEYIESTEYFPNNAESEIDHSDLIPQKDNSNNQREDLPKGGFKDEQDPRSI